VLCDWWTTLRWSVRRALPQARRRRLRAKRSASGSPGRCGQAACKGANGMACADHCKCGHCADGAPATGARSVPPRDGGLRCEWVVRKGSLPDSWAASVTFDKLLVAVSCRAGSRCPADWGPCESGKRLPLMDAQ